MRELIIVTGVEGSNRTALAKQIARNYPDLDYLPFDNVLEGVWSEYGFSNKRQKDVLYEVAKYLYKSTIMLNVKEDKSMILDYSFKAEWNTFFYELQKNYLYHITYIGCGMNSTWEEILTRWRNRIQNDDTRHLGHKCSAYHGHKVYTLYTPEELDEQMRILNREYIKNECFAFTSYCQIINEDKVKDGLIWGKEA